MDDRTQPGRDNTPPTRKAPAAPRIDDGVSDGRHGSDRTSSDRSSSAKPALTERERSERWPVG